MTNQQLAVVGQAIDGDPALSSKPSNSDGDFEIAAILNLSASPAFHVWRTSVPTQEIFDKITWANFTPNPAPDGTVQWSNRALACQGKQFNLQTMLMGQVSINASRATMRAGLQDAMTDIPSGANGNSRQAGWAAVQQVLVRGVSRVEALLADVSAGNGGTTGTAATLIFEGGVTAQDVNASRNL